ncbi:MAG: peptidase M42, partial [Christensenellaceae bacterium]|nr:peptidase M42 [Christensenellaceae bacterium]
MDWKAWLGEKCLQLVNIPSPSGFTGAIRAQICDELGAMGFAPSQTNKGSVLCALGGSGAPLILAAHVDTLGAMVRSVKANGHIRLTQVGGYAWNSVENENCRLFTRDGKELGGTIYLSEPAAHVADVAG